MTEDIVRCKHVGVRGANVGIACRNKAKIGDFCTKHKKRPKTVLGGDEVFGKPEAPVEPVKPAAAKVKYSAFRFTLNSQVDFTKMTAADKLEFKRVVKHVFSEANIVKYLNDRSAPGEPGKNIVRLDSQYYFEVGDKQGRLHIHGVLKLAHTGNYQMDRAKISGVVAGVLGHKVHLNIVGSADADAAWQAYMVKSQAAEVVKL